MLDIHKQCHVTLNRLISPVTEWENPFAIAQKPRSHYPPLRVSHCVSVQTTATLEDSGRRDHKVSKFSDSLNYRGNFYKETALTRGLLLKNFEIKTFLTEISLALGHQNGF